MPIIRSIEPVNTNLRKKRRRYYPYIDPSIPYEGGESGSDTGLITEDSQDLMTEDGQRLQQEDA